MVDAKDPFDIINEVGYSNRYHGNNIEVNLSRGQDKATLSFSKLDDIDGDKIDLANATYAAIGNYYKYADGYSTEEVQAKFREEHGRGLSAERADQLTAASEKNMDALKRVLDDMCEDRSEVASAVQDAHTGERYHEDEQRDNSEIGD